MRAISFLVLTLAVGLPAVAADAPSITVGSVAPTFESLQVLNPKTSGVTRFAFDGKPSGESKAVLLSFFATWCPGCVNEAPVLAELQRTYGSKGLKVVSLTIENKRGRNLAVAVLSETDAVSLASALRSALR